MKKRGFTLVELLVVIAIVGLLIAIAVPSGIAISKKVKMKMLDTKIEIIENGAIEWGQKNKNKIKTGKNNCTIDEIVNDEKVSHCISIPLSDLLDKNALEEDKIVDNKKILINPLTNDPLNNCSVEIYIKNKRVYAKYNINGTNCGYEKEETIIPRLQISNYNEIKLKTSEEVYELYKNNYNIINEIQSGNCMEFETCEVYNGGNKLKLYQGSIEIEFSLDDIIIDKNWNKNNREWTFTYSIKPGRLNHIPNIGKTESITQVVKLIDNSGPVLVNYMDQKIYNESYSTIFPAYLSYEENNYIASPSFNDSGLFDNYYYSDQCSYTVNLLENIDYFSNATRKFDKMTIMRDYLGNQTEETFTYEWQNHYPFLEYNGGNLYYYCQPNLSTEFILDKIITTDVDDDLDYSYYALECKDPFNDLMAYQYEGKTPEGSYIHTGSSSLYRKEGICSLEAKSCDKRGLCSHINKYIDIFPQDGC